MSFKVSRKSIQWNGKELFLETGMMSRRSLSSVLLGYGDCRILCNINCNTSESKYSDFMNLSVHFNTKNYAFGKIPGGFIKREGKPSDQDVLISRIIDRSIRPLIKKDFYNEITLICELLCYDDSISVDVLAVISAMAALSISGIPYSQIIGCSKVCKVDNDYLFNIGRKINDQKYLLNLLVSVTKKSVLMLECDANEAEEKEIMDAMELAQKHAYPVISLIEDFMNLIQSDVGILSLDKDKDKDSVDLYNKMFESIKSEFLKSIEEAYSIDDKNERIAKLNIVQDNIRKKYIDDTSDNDKIIVNEIIKKLEKYIVRNNIVFNNKRIDSRECNEIRSIDSRINFLGPKVHGSALFTRGNTQALAALTLGSLEEGKITDDFSTTKRENFMLHYNFPPYSVGDSAFPRATNRREVGHGKLAYKAIFPMLPSIESFAYTIRIVSDVLSSDGSSSMATVCASSLALMDCGVPIKKPVSGIAMGLVKEGTRYAVLSDISGEEDSLGDMDFKVAGTLDGITALQMDIKIDEGVPQKLLQFALTQAKEGRVHILQKMNSVISNSNDVLKQSVPRGLKFNISTDKIRELIGSGGKTIKEICMKYNVKIDISKEGEVSILSQDNKASEEAKIFITCMLQDILVGSLLENCLVTEDNGNNGFLVILPNGKHAILSYEDIDQYNQNTNNENIDTNNLVTKRLPKLWISSVSRFKDRISVSLSEVTNASNNNALYKDKYNKKRNYYDKRSVNQKIHSSSDSRNNDYLPSKRTTSNKPIDNDDNKNTSSDNGDGSRFF